MDNLWWRLQRWQFMHAVRLRWQRLDSIVKDFIKTYIIGKSLRQVERFIAGWTAVLLLIIGLLFVQRQALDAYYQVPGPAPGGTYVEGIVGESGIINPLFAADDLNQSASRLVFSSLFQREPGGKIAPDLAADWQLSDDQIRYTVKLRQNVRWHDGQLLNADDVLFTHQLLQNPDVDSPLELNWRGIEATKTDDYTVVFTLPNAYAPFLGQLTYGILPEHLLRDIQPERLRIAAFSSAPIGSGPFRFDGSSLDGRTLRFSRNQAYYRQPPRLEGLQLRTYESKSAMIEDYNRGLLSAMSLYGQFDQASLQQPEDSRVQVINITSQAFIFFNTERLNVPELRRALAQSLDAAGVAAQLGDAYRSADSPLLPEHLGYQPASINYNRRQALKTFKEAGWSMQNGVLAKDGKSLEFELLVPDGGHYAKAAKAVSSQWRSIGVGVKLQLLTLPQLQADRLRPRNYDAVLVAINLGSDPDVYAYWHSSQSADPGSNLSLYNSEIADEALAAGRTRHQSALRAAKYRTFQERWQDDVPAIPLYRLQDAYVTRSNVRSVAAGDIAGSADRFYNVTTWTVQTQPTLQRLQ